MNYLFYLTALLLFFTKCSSETDEKNIKNSNGYSIKCSKISRKNAQKKYFDDVHYRCFARNVEGDTVRIASFSKDSLRHGRYKEFYNNGAIKLEGLFARGGKLRKFKHYRRDGTIKKQVEYIIVKGESKMNRVLIHDSSGALKPNKSKYFEVKYKDSVNRETGNPVKIKFNNIFNKKFDSVEVHFGGFGHFFSIKDSSEVKIKRFPSENVRFMYNEDSKLGENNLTFLFSGFNRHPDGSLEKGENFYISYTYYVSE